MTHFQCHWLFVNMTFTKEDKDSNKKNV